MIRGPRGNIMRTDMNSQFHDRLGPTVLTGDDAMRFAAWLEADCTPSTLKAVGAAAASGRRLLSGAPVSLASGLVLRFVPSAPRRRRKDGE